MVGTSHHHLHTPLLRARCSRAACSLHFALCPQTRSTCEHASCPRSSSCTAPQLGRSTLPPPPKLSPSSRMCHRWTGMRREAALVDRPAPSMERDRLLHRQGESQCTALLEAAELQRRRQGGVGRGGMVLVRGAGEVGGMGARHTHWLASPS